MWSYFGYIAMAVSELVCGRHATKTKKSDFCGQNQIPQVYAEHQFLPAGRSALVDHKSPVSDFTGNGRMAVLELRATRRLAEFRLLLITCQATGPKSVYISISGVSMWVWLTYPTKARLSLSALSDISE